MSASLFQFSIYTHFNWLKCYIYANDSQLFDLQPISFSPTVQSHIPTDYLTTISWPVSVSNLVFPELKSWSYPSNLLHLKFLPSQLMVTPSFQLLSSESLEVILDSLMHFIQSSGLYFAKESDHFSPPPLEPLCFKPLSFLPPFTFLPLKFSPV